MAEWMWSAMEVIDVIPLAGVILVPLICKIKYGRFFRGFLWGIPMVAVLFYLFYRFMGPGDEIIFFWLGHVAAHRGLFDRLACAVAALCQGSKKPPVSNAFHRMGVYRYLKNTGQI